MAVPTDVYEIVSVLLAMAMAGFCLVKLSRSPIGKAVAHRISGEKADDRMADLEDCVERLEGQVLDYQERLDFAERIIARGGSTMLPTDEPAWEATPDLGAATPV